jgi:hypothetical protein
LMPFQIDAWVVLPEHMHAIWTLPEGDDDFPRRWRAIKMASCRDAMSTFPYQPSPARVVSAGCGSDVTGSTPSATSGTTRRISTTCTSTR